LVFPDCDDAPVQSHPFKEKRERNGSSRTVRHPERAIRVLERLVDARGLVKVSLHDFGAFGGELCNE
jgi:hypothetical protein